MREPPVHNFDLGIMKNFRLTERVRFHFVNNWVNAINISQWYGSTQNCATAPKGCFRQTANYHTQSNLPRQIQFAGRVTF